MTEFSLTKPPLICVAARVQFTPLAKIADYIPNLQEALRLQGYPHFLQQQTKSWRIDQHAEAGKNVTFEEIPRWSFTNIDKTIAIRLEYDSVTIFFVEYQEFAQARPYYEEILRILGTVIPAPTIVQLQLRYINHIPVGNEESPAFWVRPSVLGVPKVGDLIRHGNISETVFQTPEGWGIVVRCSALAKGMILPADILPLDINLKDNLKLNSEQPFILLENVFIRQPSSHVFDPTACLEDISQLRKHIKTIFMNTVTEKALEQWK